MSTNFTNQKAAQALRGQGVLVSLNGADSANLYKLREGQLASVASSGNTGLVGKVNVYGTSFIVNPIQPNLVFGSVTPYGYLAANETITVTT